MGNGLSGIDRSGSGKPPPAPAPRPPNPCVPPQLLSCIVRAMTPVMWSYVRHALVLLGIAQLTAGCCGTSDRQRMISNCSRGGVDAVLREMDTQYQSFRFYEDTGDVTVRITDETSNQEIIEGRFRTRFDRAGSRFLFDYRVGANEKAQAATWRQRAGPAQCWFWRDVEPREDDLRHCLQVLAGVTNGTSRTIPSLLLGHEPAGRSSLKLDGEELVNGVACVRLYAEDDAGTTTIWVAKDSHTVRRSFTRQRLIPTEEDLAMSLRVLPPGASEQLRVEVSKRRSSGRFLLAETEVNYFRR